MRKQWFAVAFCGFLMLVVGLLWSRVRELERVVEVLKSQRVSMATVGWQNETPPGDSEKKKRIFKLIDTPPVVTKESNVGVPWDVERGMRIESKSKRAQKLK